MGEGLVETERSKCCLGMRYPVLARVRMLWLLSGGATVIARGGGVGGSEGLGGDEEAMIGLDEVEVGRRVYTCAKRGRDAAAVEETGAAG